MALPSGFIGTIEDDEEVEFEGTDSEEDEVSASLKKITFTSKSICSDSAPSGTKDTLC